MTEASVATAIDLSKYEQFENKKVNLTYVIDNETLTDEGTLVAVAAGQGVMFRKRGSQTPLTIREANLRAIEPIAEAPKKVTAKKLKKVTLDDARSHLADRHGYKLSAVNGASAEQALLAHQQIDHSDLGHTHEDESSAAVATAAASPATETQ